MAASGVWWGNQRVWRSRICWDTHPSRLRCTMAAGDAPVDAAVDDATAPAPAAAVPAADAAAPAADTAAPAKDGTTASVIDGCLHPDAGSRLATARSLVRSQPRDAAIRPGQYAVVRKLLTNDHGGSAVTAFPTLAGKISSATRSLRSSFPPA